MTTRQTDHGQVLEIRKYPNRRYYDTTRSQHVTLEEIRSLVRDGHEVRVIDSKTREEITAKVLTQIILDLDSPKLSIFPVPLLHRLIRANEMLVQDFVDKYFNQALNAFLDSQRQFEQYLRQTMQLHSSRSAVSDWTRLMLSPFAPPVRASRKDETQAEVSAEPANDEEMRVALDDLRRQVAELRQELGNHKESPRKR